MSGRLAWPQQNVQPVLLPSFGSYRAIYGHTALKTRFPGERSARLCHIGREVARDERVGQRGCIYARVRERTTRQRWRSPRPWIKHLSTAVRSVSGTGLHLTATRREVHRSPRLRYRAGLSAVEFLVRENRFSSVGLPFFPVTNRFDINKLVNYFHNVR